MGKSEIVPGGGGVRIDVWQLWALIHQASVRATVIVGLEMGSGGLCQGGPTQEESIRKNEAIKRAKRDADELAEKDKKKFIANAERAQASRAKPVMEEWAPPERSRDGPVRQFRQVEPVCVLRDPDLLIGNHYHTSDLKALEERRLLCVVHISRGVPHHESKLEYLKIPCITDQQDKDPLMFHFDTAFEFIAQKRSEGEPVMVQCLDGCTLAPVVCAAFLMRFAKASPTQALEHVEECYPVILDDGEWKRRVLIPPRFRDMLEEYQSGDWRYDNKLEYHTPSNGPTFESYRKGLLGKEPTAEGGT